MGRNRENIVVGYCFMMQGPSGMFLLVNVSDNEEYLPLVDRRSDCRHLVAGCFIVTYLLWMVKSSLPGSTIPNFFLFDINFFLIDHTEAQRLLGLISLQEISQAKKGLCLLCDL